MTYEANTLVDEACDSIKDVTSTPCKLKVFSEELKHFEPQNWIIVFESYPVWLFSILKDFSKVIYFPQVTNWTQLRAKISSANEAGNIALFDSLITGIGRRLFGFGTAPKDGIFLVSGSVLFLNEHLLNRRGVGLLDRYERGRNLPVSALNFYQVQHAKIGGATTFRTLWCYNWPTKLTVIPSFMRTISHFIDFGVRTGTKLSDTQV